MKRFMLVTILVLVIPAVLSAQISWTEHTIDSTFNNAIFVYAIDIEPDGDIDVLGADLFGTDIAWWENDGASPPTFTEHIIDSTFSYVRSVFAIDINGDSAVDVLAASPVADDITWWENDGNENFTEHTIDSLFDGAWSVYAIDVEPDGDVDVLGAANTADKITWWENDGNENFTEHTIDSLFDNAYSVFAIDINGDSAVDVLGASVGDSEIAWWENDGNENFTKHTIDNSFSSAVSVYAIDMDGDLDVDVLGAASLGNSIAWWENDGASPPTFTKHIIDSTFSNVRSVFAIDINGDSAVDVLGASTGDSDITWWENDGGENFTEHTIDSLFDGAQSVFAIDINGDSAVDVLGAGGNCITWWENIPVVLDVGTVSIDIPSTVPEDTAFNPQATVTNFGSGNETFLVTCTIDPGDYNRSRTVNNLAPGDSTQVTFLLEFTFESGFYTVTVYTKLTDDENPANDTLEKVIETYDPGIAEYEDRPAFFSFGLQSNPVKGKAVFNLALPQPAIITLRIYDVSGRLIDKLISEKKSAGFYEIPWSKDVSSGIFFYHLESPWQRKLGKLVLVR